MEALMIGLVVGTACGFLTRILYHFLSGNACLYTISGVIFGGWLPSVWMNVHYPIGAQTYGAGLIFGIMVGLGFAAAIAEAIRRLRNK